MIEAGLAGEGARWASASPAAATIVMPIFRAMCMIAEFSERQCMNTVAAERLLAAADQAMFEIKRSRQLALAEMGVLNQLAVKSVLLA